MNQSDIEFTMGLDTSPAEQKLNQFQQSIRNSVVREMGGLNSQNTTPNFTNSIRSNYQFDAGLLRKAQSILDATTKSMSQTMQKFEQIWNSANYKGFGFEKSNPYNVEYGPQLQETRTKQREITDEVKTQNREHNESYIKLSKLHKLLLSILAAWQSIKKAIGLNVDMAARLNQERGFFSVDAKSVFDANRDRTYAMVHRGAEALGKAAPFSSASVDQMVSQMQEIQLKALRGEGIADDQYVIAMQRLFDKFGIGENAADLLSNGNVNLYDLGVKMLKLLETKGMPALENMSGIDRQLLTGDVLKVFGKEIANGIAASYNTRKITGETETAIEKYLRLGGSAVSNVNVTSAAWDTVNSLGKFRRSLDELSQVLLVTISPSLTKSLNVLSKVADWLADKLNLGHFSKDREGLVNMGAIEQGRTGFWSSFFATRIADWNPVSKEDKAATESAMSNFDRKGFVSRMAKKKMLTASELFNMILLNSSAAGTSDFGTREENLAGAYALTKLVEWSKAGTLKESKYDKFYGRMTGLGELGSELYNVGKLPAYVETWEDVLDYAKSEPKMRSFYKKYQELFSEGGSLDIQESEITDPAAYFDRILHGIGIKEFQNLFYKGAGMEEFGDMIRSVVTELREGKTYGDSLKFDDIHVIIDWTDRAGITHNEDVVTNAHLK